MSDTSQGPTSKKAAAAAAKAAAAVQAPAQPQAPDFTCPKCGGHEQTVRRAKPGEVGGYTRVCLGLVVKTARTPDGERRACRYTAPVPRWAPPVAPAEPAT
jgi:hypothetical protein